MIPQRNDRNRNGTVAFHRGGRWNNPVARSKGTVTMLSKTYPIIVAVAFAAMPVAGVYAQQNNPTGNLGSNRSSTATPGTADSGAASGMHTGDVRSSTGGTSNSGGSSMASQPGATGRTVVPGNNSSVSGDTRATTDNKTGGGQGSGGGGR